MKKITSVVLAVIMTLGVFSSLMVYTVSAETEETKAVMNVTDWDYVEEFNGTSLPSGWQIQNPANGTYDVSGGKVSMTNTAGGEYKLYYSGANIRRSTDFVLEIGVDYVSGGGWIYALMAGSGKRIRTSVTSTDNVLKMDYDTDGTLEIKNASAHWNVIRYECVSIVDHGTTNKNTQCKVFVGDGTNWEYIGTAVLHGNTSAASMTLIQSTKNGVMNVDYVKIKYNPHMKEVECWNYVENFDGTALPAGWTIGNAGNGMYIVADGKVHIEKTAEDTAEYILKYDGILRTDDYVLEMGIKFTKAGKIYASMAGVGYRMYLRPDGSNLYADSTGWNQSIINKNWTVLRLYGNVSTGTFDVYVGDGTSWEYVNTAELSANTAAPVISILTNSAGGAIDLDYMKIAYLPNRELTIVDDWTYSSDFTSGILADSNITRTDNKTTGNAIIDNGKLVLTSTSTDEITLRVDNCWLQKSDSHVVEMKFKRTGTQRMSFMSYLGNNYRIHAQIMPTYIQIQSDSKASDTATSAYMQKIYFNFNDGNYHTLRFEVEKNLAYMFIDGTNYGVFALNANNGSNRIQMIAINSEISVEYVKAYIPAVTSAKHTAKTTVGDYDYENNTCTKSVICSVCGDTISSENISIAELDSTSITIGSDLKLNAYVKANAAQDLLSVRFTKNGKSEIADTYTEVDGLLRFENPGIVNPQCLNDTFTIELIATVEENEYVLDTVENYSVISYLNTLKTDEQYADYRDIADKTVKYGIASQLYTGYNVADLVYDVNNLIDGFTAAENPVRDLSGNTGKQIKGAGLILSDYNYIYFKYQASGDAVVTLLKGGAEVDTDKLITDNGDGTFVLKTDALKANELDTVFTLTVTDGDSVSTVSYNGEAYVNAKAESADVYGSITIGNFVKVLYNYCAAAKALTEN